MDAEAEDFLDRNLDLLRSRCDQRELHYQVNVIRERIGAAGRTMLFQQDYEDFIELKVEVTRPIEIVHIDFAITKDGVCVDCEGRR